MAVLPADGRLCLSARGQPAHMRSLPGCPLALLPSPLAPHHTRPKDTARDSGWLSLEAHGHFRSAPSERLGYRIDHIKKGTGAVVLQSLLGDLDTVDQDVEATLGTSNTGIASPVGHDQAVGSVRYRLEVEGEEAAVVRVARRKPP